MAPAISRSGGRRPIAKQTELSSLIIGVVLASAVIPTFIAQKWFLPVHEEDLAED